MFVEDTEACIECHRSVHPRIVAGWRESRMAKVTPVEALNFLRLGRMTGSIDLE